MNSKIFTNKLWLPLAAILAMTFLASGMVLAEDNNQADLRETKVSLRLNNGSIIEIMDEISKQTEYVFIYEDGIKKDLNQKVRIENNTTVHGVLSDITKQSNLEFRAVNKNIVIRKRPADVGSLIDTHQGRIISGKVTAASDGSGLPGVNVIIKDTQEGTITDMNGDYSLQIPSGDVTLVFSYVGYNSSEVAIGGRSVVDVELTESVEALQEVVVTALGIEREQRSLGYDVGNVDGDELREVAQDNVLNSLAGRVAGVTINQTSGAGSSVSVIIRGASSLTTDNQPLFVVDGVFMNNSLNNVAEQGSGNQVDYGNAISDINPDDIESMTVLKGPSAAALYGTRAGNGVIIITTKSGSKAKRLGVDVSTNTLFEFPTKLLDFHYKYANGERNFRLEEGSAYWGGPELDAGIVEQQFGYDEPTELRSYPNNMREFLQTGITSMNNVALTGGGDKGNFRISYANTTMRGMIPNHDRYVNSLRTNINY